MWYACLFLLLQVPGAQPAQPPAAGAEQPTTAPTYDQGPLRGEIDALRDSRFWFMDSQPNNPKSDLQMRLRIRGERVDQIARSGNVILDEAVDDTGKALFSKTYTQEERDSTRPVTVPADRLRSSGWQLSIGLDSPTRAAKSVKLRGSVRLVLAKDREDITVDNPLQYVGKTIENPRLRELGVEVRVLPPSDVQEEAEPLPPGNKLMVFQYVKGAERVQGVTFYDANMKALRGRERPLQTKAGEAVVGQQLTADLSADCQAVFQVFPQVEDLRLPLQLDVPLP